MNATPPQIKPWKTFFSGMDYREVLFQKLKEHNISHAVWADDLLTPRQFPPINRRHQVQVGRMTLQELGLKPGDSTEIAGAELEDLGVGLSHFMPVHVFELSLHYPEQPDNETIVFPLPRMQSYASMYLSGKAHQSIYRTIRADQRYKPLRLGDYIGFVLPSDNF